MRKAGRVVVLVAVVFAAGLFSQMQAIGQDIDSSVVSEVVVEENVSDMDGVFNTGMTWDEIMQSGGWLMYALGVMSVMTMAFIIYFFFVLRVGLVVPRPLYRDLLEKTKAGMIEEAVKVCEYHPCPLSSVALMGIEHIISNPDIDPVLLKDMVASEGERQADQIQGQTQYLLDIGVIAPMVGLLGTVFGMLHAFSGVALSSALSKPVVLAGGVSKALITTASGLMVAIPAMIAYAYFRRRAVRLVSYLESASTEILAILVNKGA